MDRFGDPSWLYHKALGEIWALMILDLADRPIAPFDLEAYGRAIKQWIDDLDTYARDPARSIGELDLSPLREASQVLEQGAQAFQKFEQDWTVQVYGTGGFFESSPLLTMKRLEHNDRMTNFESDLLDLRRR